MPPKFEITKAEEEESKLIASIRERLARSSPGPCRLSMYDPDRDPVELFRENLSHGSGNVWAVGLPEHPLSVGGWEDRPAHLVITCVTGNGPTSEANAVFYANARADIEVLLSRLDDVERERDSERANDTTDPVVADYNRQADEIMAAYRALRATPEQTVARRVSALCADVVAERDRLLDILACERGERAPEGWESTFVVEYEGDRDAYEESYVTRWQRIADGIHCYAGHSENTHPKCWWSAQDRRNGNKIIGSGEAESLLEAIEAADRAAKDPT